MPLFVTRHQGHGDYQSGLSLAVRQGLQLGGMVKPGLRRIYQPLDFRVKKLTRHLAKPGEFRAAQGLKSGVIGFVFHMHSKVVPVTDRRRILSDCDEMKTLP